MPPGRYAGRGLRLLVASAMAVGAISEPAGGSEIPLRGVVRAVQQALISTELAARVLRVHVREGDAFKKDQTLVEFDCRRQTATVAAADAQMQEMQFAVDKNRLLLRTQAVGKNELEVSEARLAKAKAEADALRSQLDQCVLIAPFDGRVMEIGLQVHETPQPGKPFIGLVANDKLEVDLIVPSSSVRAIALGAVFRFHIDELQRPVPAMVARMGAVVDPISQTIKMIAIIDNQSGEVLPGMSGTADVLRGEAR